MESPVSGLVNIGEPLTIDIIIQLFSHYFFDQFGYKTEAGYRSVIFEEIFVRLGFLRRGVTYAVLKQFGKLPSLSE